jgi:hypothetical protein
MTAPADIVHAALEAKTEFDANHVQTLLTTALGARHERPVGDKWNNHGLMSTSGSFDLKLIENVTNMQDAVLERHALLRYGTSDKVPYPSPQAAASALFPGQAAELARLATVTFQESDPPTGTTKRLTPVFRDQGCGMRPESVPTTIFGLGGSQKDEELYQQGAFGLGGAMTFRNAKAVVLVSRRDPALLGTGEEDLVTVAVVQWRTNVKGRTAYYLVDQEWRTAGDAGQPWSCPAAEVPDFEPGTHLALVSYRVDGFHRRFEGDERSFDTVTNTRLFRPVLPILFRNMIVRGEKRATTLRGLEHRLDNAKHELNEGEDHLPFYYDGTTYQLPVRYVLFASKPGDSGGRRSFMAKDHAVLFLSNGQTHHHWSPQQFKTKTKKLNKLFNRILVVVETDALPIDVRTGLFTADRSELVRGDAALRLEEDLRGFLDDWDALRDENNAAIKEALTGTGTEPTIEAARKISRALNIPGFGFAGDTGSGGGGGKPGTGQGGGGGKPSKPIDLKKDPTKITGPHTVQAVIGRTRSITYTVDVVDEFFEGRGHLTIDCDHPQINTADITIGKGNKGRVRVGIAVPDVLETGTYELRIKLTGWSKASGGIGPDLPEHTTKLELVEEIPGRGSGTGKPTSGTGSAGGPSLGSTVALNWTGVDNQDEWGKTTVGEIIDTPAHVLANNNPEYADLASLGEQTIPTVMLNADFPQLKKYLAGRSKLLDTLESPKERYAVGVGVALLMLKDSADNRSADDPITDTVLADAQRAAAKAVLAVMPAFDDLSKAAGLDEGSGDDDT